MFVWVNIEQCGHKSLNYLTLAEYHNRYETVYGQSFYLTVSKFRGDLHSQQSLGGNMGLKIRTSLCTAFLLLASSLAIAEPTDTRLVGNWEGQRDQEGKCSFMAWRMARTADGKFEIAFYADSGKKQIIGKEKGRWEVKGDKLSLLTDGVPTPDVYVYTFIDDNSVRFSNVKRDPSADCMADYEFTDHRVSK